MSNIPLQQAWNNAMVALSNFNQNPAQYFLAAYQLRECVTNIWLERDKKKKTDRRTRGLSRLGGMAADDQEKILDEINIDPQNLEQLKKNNILYDIEIIMDCLQKFCKEDPDFGKNEFYGTFFHTRIAKRINKEYKFPPIKNLTASIEQIEAARILKHCFELAITCRKNGVPEEQFPNYFAAYLKLIAPTNQKGYAYQVTYLMILCSSKLLPSMKHNIASEFLPKYYETGLKIAEKEKQIDPKRFASYFVAGKISENYSANTDEEATLYAIARTSSASALFASQLKQLPRIKERFEKLSPETQRTCADMTKKLWTAGFSLAFTDAYIAKFIIQDRSPEFAVAYATYRTQYEFGPNKSNFYAFIDWLKHKLSFGPFKFKTVSPIRSSPQENYIESFTTENLFNYLDQQIKTANKTKERTPSTKSFSFTAHMLKLFSKTSATPELEQEGLLVNPNKSEI